MPYLPTDRVRRAGLLPPDNADRPLVLTRREGSSVLVVGGCPRARRLGLRAGWSLGEAQASTPEIVALTHEPQHDQALLRRLADWALRFSPIVEPVEPDTLLIDITGCQRLFGGESNIARQARDGLVRLGLHARAAVADTIGAAYALATSATETPVIVPEGQGSAYLAALPPISLRIDPSVDARLASLGVRTIGDLLALPRASLPARFGNGLVLRLRQALGEVFEGVAAHKPEESASARIAFDGVLHDLPPIQSAAARLLGEVFAQVLQQEQALRRLDCVVYYERVSPTVVSLGLARASRAEKHVVELLRQRLEHTDLSPGVSGLLVVARETSRWVGGQGDLFEPRSPGDDEALGCLVDRLVSRLGEAGVVRAGLVDDHQPEMAYRYAGVGRWESEKVRRKALASRGLQDGLRGIRPLQLFPRPLPIRVIAVTPDGPPTWFFDRGREHVVARAWGPERLETAWWRGRDVRRDYFRVTSETGEQFWVFCALPERQWYLHGVFA